MSGNESIINSGEMQKGESMGEGYPEQAGFRYYMKDKWARTIGLASLVSIALGGFNDTMDALDKIYDISLSQLTDIPSHNKLSKIYIRASSAVLDDVFGAPIYLKHSSNGEVIKYYLDDNFVISVITNDDAIAAYLVFPNEDFTPDTGEHTGKESLLELTFSAVESVNEFRASYAKTGNYYIEENNGGEFGLLYSSISGFSEYLSPMDNKGRKLLSDVVDALMFEEDISKKVQTLRKNIQPNFYGYSTLGLHSIEEAILSNSEYKLIHKG